MMKAATTRSYHKLLMDELIACFLALPSLPIYQTIFLILTPEAERNKSQRQP